MSIMLPIPPPPQINFKQVADVHENWYEHHASREHRTFVFLNFLTSV